jgi:hypothetical protein
VLLAAIVASGGLCAAAESLAEIRVQGNDTVPAEVVVKAAETVIRVGAALPGGVIPVNQVRQAVQRLGYFEDVRVTSAKGELLLIDTSGTEYRLISRLRIFDDDSEVLSHPALVGPRMYVRDGSSICCVMIAPP